MGLPRPRLEVCVDSLAGLEPAERAGAARIELCARLDLGGVSPSAELVRAALAATSLPLAVMVRPRPGDFVYARAEIETMLAELARLRGAGAAIAVLGALTPSGAIDREALRELVAGARPMAVTFHRAFDEVPDPLAALEELVELGVERVLTAGGAPDAFLGRRALRALVLRARGRIAVMAGGGVRASNAAAILADAGVLELHGSVPFRIPETEPEP